ncbi:MAG: hypothetical protein JXN64_00810, partial [Spirochaetes bacterium]|nr:hypothetical protein [Spirochaetota bacterium]
MKSLFKILLCRLIVCCFVDYVNAQYYRSEQGLTVSGNAPVTGDAGLNAVLASQFAVIMDEAFDELVKFSNQPDLAKGFANANAYTAQAATHQGYQDYSLFAVTTGIMVAAQLPSSNKDYYDDLDEKIKDDGDLYAGVSAGLSIINFGLNAGFLYPGLYLNAKFGYFSNDSLVDNLSTKS